MTLPAQEDGQLHRTGGPTPRWPAALRTFALVISLEARRMTALAMSLSSSLMWLLTTVSMALRIIVRYGCASCGAKACREAQQGG